jgi:CheY-like chemotaxis protein
VPGRWNGGSGPLHFATCGNVDGQAAQRETARTCTPNLIGTALHVTSMEGLVVVPAAHCMNGSECMEQMSASVLMVEDDLAMATMLVEHLRHCSFQTSHCRGAEEALALLGRRSFDAVVADVRLGESIDGFHLCQGVRAAHPHTRVILITAFGGADTRAAAQRAGADDLLSKPFALETLVERLRRALARDGRSTSPTTLPGDP